MTLTDRERGRIGLLTAIIGIGAARRKPTARRHIPQRWRLALDRIEALRALLQLGYRAQQRLGIGVRRPIEDLPHRPAFNGTTGIHDHDTVAHLGYDAK